MLLHKHARKFRLDKSKRFWVWVFFGTFFCTMQVFQPHPGLLFSAVDLSVMAMPWLLCSEELRKRLWVGGDEHQLDLSMKTRCFNAVFPRSLEWMPTNLLAICLTN